DAVCERFFAINVLAGVRGCDGGDRMPMVGGGDQHRVDIVAGEQFAEVAIAGAIFVFVVRVDHAFRFRPMTGVDAGNRYDLDVGLFDELVDEVSPHASGADEAHGGPVAGRNGSVSSEGAGGNDRGKADSADGGEAPEFK